MYVDSFEEAAPIGAGIFFASQLSQSIVNWYGGSRLVQVIVNHGVFHALGYAVKQQCKPTAVISGVAQKAYSYYCWNNVLGSFEYLIQPLMGDSLDGGQSSKIFSIARRLIGLLGISQIGSIILRDQLQKRWRKEDYGNLAERVTEAVKIVFITLGAIHFGSNPNSPKTFGSVEALFVALTVIRASEFALEYVLKTRWAKNEDSTKEWQQGFHDKLLAEKISQLSRLFFLNAIAWYCIPQYAPICKWPAHMICGFISLLQGVQIVFPSYLKVYKNWHHQNHIVQLAGRINRLYYRVYDRKTQRFLKEYPLGLRDRQEERDRILRKCTILDSLNRPYMKEPLVVWKGNEEVSLLKIKNRFIIAVEDYTSEIGYSRFSVREWFFEEFQSVKTQADLKQVLEKVEEENSLMCRRLEHLIKPVEVLRKQEEEGAVIEGLPINREVRFFIRSSCSKIDRRFSVSEHCWGISMIRHRGPMNQHATLIFEGMELGKYVMYAAELNDVDKIVQEKVEHVFGTKKTRLNREPSELEWEGRTCVFKVEKDTVKKLWLEIDKEKIDRQKGFVQGFSRFGNLSFSDQSEFLEGIEMHNCFTWARSKLETIGIRIGKKDLDYIVAVPGFYMFWEQSFRSFPYPNLNWIEQQQRAGYEV